ncbi:MAG: hypothetical protein U0572_04390 [Phycisphaerales bacterium]
MRRLAPLIILLLAGCSSTPTTLVESDVPIPPGMQVCFSEGLKRNGPALTAGWFVLWGNVVDAEQQANATSERFSENGWRETDRIMLPKLAKLTFAKDTRTVLVDIDARRVDPGSSSASITVTSGGQ